MQKKRPIKPNYRGEANPADLDRNGQFNVDRFFRRLRRKHHAWNLANHTRPDWLKPREGHQ